jgi:hypothetical protein
MRSKLIRDDADAEPSAAELAAIVLEEALIAAEVELTDAQIRVLNAVPHPTDLDWRRVRRAERRVAQEAKALADRLSRRPARRRVA